MTAAEERFCHALLRSGSASEAYREASPQSRKWKNLVLRQRAHELMQRPHVKARLEELRQAITKNTEIDINRTVVELARVAYLDPIDIVDDEGRLRALKDMPQDARRAISSIKSYEEYAGDGKDRIATGMVREVKFWPKVEANDKLMRFLGAYEKDNRQKGNDPFEGVPRDVVKMIVDRLRELARPKLVG